MYKRKAPDNEFGDFANETNKQGGAWDTVFDGGKGNKSVIPTEKIQTLG